MFALSPENKFHFKAILPTCARVLTVGRVVQNNLLGNPFNNVVLIHY